MKLSLKARYRLIVLASWILSLGGILLAATTQPADGGRGGAMAVALSFYALFARENIGFAAYKRLIGSLDKDGSGLEGLKTQVRAIAARLNIEADGQNAQNKALAWSSFVGTLAWGFGDWLARGLHDAGSILFHF